MRVVHVVECPRHGAVDEARPHRRGGVLGFVHEARHGPAKVFGVPDLPLLQISHPLGGLSMDKVRERAAVALPQLLKMVKEKRS